MSEVWQFMQSVQGRYGYRHVYGEPDFTEPRKDAHDMDLDAVDPGLVGSAQVLKILRWADQLGFECGVQACRILTEDGEAKAYTWKQEENWVQPERDRKRTPTKWWDKHIKVIEKWKIIREVEVQDTRVICTYFAVPKDDKVARTIFNGRYLSEECCHVPPSVNLLDIEELLTLISEMDNISMYFADIRHWFHTLPCCGFLSANFSIRIVDPEGKERFFSWRVGAMGFSWMPRLSQCVAWTMILHQEEPHRKNYRFDIFKEVGTPPKYVRIFRKSDDQYVGFVTLLYDNVGIFGNDPIVGQEVHASVQANAALASIQLKDSSVLAANPRQVNIEHEQPDARRSKRSRRSNQFNEKMVYRGIQFASMYDKKKETFIPVWRCDPKKVKRWQERGLPVEDKKYLLTELASWIGVVMWSRVVSRTPCCEAADVIDILRRIATLAAGKYWTSGSTTLSADEHSALNAALVEAFSNAWNQPPQHRPSGAPFIFSTDASSTAWGFCVLSHEGGRTPEQKKGIFKRKFGLSKMIIYHKELIVAINHLKAAMKKYGGTRPIVVVGDNTAACAALRRRYSTNRIANTWLKSLHQVAKETGASYRVVTVRSEDMAADPLSRPKEFPNHVCQYTDGLFMRCRQIVEDELNGIRRESSARGAKLPTGVRHRDPPDEDDSNEAYERYWKDLEEWEDDKDSDDEGGIGDSDVDDESPEALALDDMCKTIL